MDLTLSYDQLNYCWVCKAPLMDALDLSQCTDLHQLQFRVTQRGVAHPACHRSVGHTLAGCIESKSAFHKQQAVHAIANATHLDHLDAKWRDAYDPKWIPVGSPPGDYFVFSATHRRAVRDLQRIESLPFCLRNDWIGRESVVITGPGTLDLRQSLSHDSYASFYSPTEDTTVIYVELKTDQVVPSVAPGRVHSVQRMAWYGQDESPDGRLIVSKGVWVSSSLVFFVPCLSSDGKVCLLECEADHLGILVPIYPVVSKEKMLKWFGSAVRVSREF